jgi:hypothetical protein
MPKHEFDTNNQPDNRAPRGKSFKTKLIESLERKGMTEEGFIDLLVDKAITDGGVFLSELLKRYNPAPKSTLAPVTFEFKKEWTPLQKADAIMNAMSTGEIPPDVGVMIIEGINKMLGIEETTELAKRLEAIEKLLEDKK